MANVTDPLIKSIQGSDPQNLMEYITRQKIYDSRFWKEECFGLNVADVMERAAKTLTCVGGTYSGIAKPTKFLCLTLKLLQLQPDKELIETFLEQDHFKYLRVLGAFYLRLTGRPQDIYELLDPLYADYSKLRYRTTNEWKLVHVDEFIDELLTKPFCCGIAMPRLPTRETLQEAGYLDEGPRPTALHDALTAAGGIREYLRARVDREQQLGPSPGGAIALWEKRYGTLKAKKTTKPQEEEADMLRDSSDRIETSDTNDERIGKRKVDHEDDIVCGEKKKKKKDKKKSDKYGTLFKSTSKTSSSSSRSKDSKYVRQDGNTDSNDAAVDKDSDEYWNNLRASLGMSALKK